jgi:hypothetical protein
MKKILLGTSALIGAATLLAGAALADDPKVTIGGFSTFEAGWDHSDFTSGSRQLQLVLRKRKIMKFPSAMTMKFISTLPARPMQGLGYGAEIDLQADIDGSESYTCSQSGASQVQRYCCPPHLWLVAG